MADEGDNVVIDLDAEDSSLTKTLDDSAKQVEQFAQNTTRAFEDIDFNEDVVSELSRMTEILDSLSESLDQNKQATEGVGDAQQENAETGGSLLDTFSKIGNVITGLKSLWDMLSGAISTATGYIEDWIAAAGESELQETRLTAVFNATGDAIGYTSEQLVQMSEDLQEVSRFEAETAQQAMSALMAFKNIRGDVFRDATTAAADLAEAMGMDLVGATRLLGRALQEPGEGLMALRRSGITFTDQEHEMIKAMMDAGQVMEAQNKILDKVKSTFGGVAEAIGETHVGKWERLNNAVGDVWESFGASFIPVMDMAIPVIDKLRVAGENLAPIMEQVAQSLKMAAEVVVEALRPVAEDTIDVLIGAVAAIETIAMKWEEVSRLLGTSITYSLVKMYNEMTYYLTEVLPDLLMWFADNWVEIFMDVQRAQDTILMNMGKNVLSFVSYVKDLLMGKPGEFMFTGLLEGFQATVDELPELRQRVEGEMERILREDMEAAADTIGRDFNERFNRNKEFLENLFVERDKEVEEKIAAKPDLNFDIDKPKEEKKDGSASPIEALDALAKRIESSTGKKPEEVIAKANIDAAGLVVDAVENGFDKLTMESLESQISSGFSEMAKSLEKDLGLVTDAVGEGKEPVVETMDAIMEAEANQDARDKRTASILEDIKTIMTDTASSTRKLSEDGLVARYA